MKLFLYLTLIGLFTQPVFGQEQNAKGGYFKIYIKSPHPQNFINKIKNEISELKGSQIGKTPLGTQKRGTYIFKFVLPIDEVTKLTDSLKDVGSLRIIRRHLKQKIPKNTDLVILYLRKETQKPEFVAPQLPKVNLEEFNVRLPFSPRENGFISDKYRFEYMLTKKSVFRVGSKQYPRKAFLWTSISSDEGAKSRFYWPIDFGDKGEIRIFDDKGNVFWEKKLEDLKVKMVRSKKSQVNKIARYYIEQVFTPDQVNEMSKCKSLKFVLVKSPNENTYLRYSSRKYKWRITKKKRPVFPVKERVRKKIFINGKRKKLEGEFVVKKEGPVEIKVNYPDGSYLELLETTPPFLVHDYFNKNKIEENPIAVLIGEGKPPLDEQTLPDLEGKWRLEISPGKSRLRFSENEIIPFDLLLNWDREPPQREWRPRLKGHATGETYLGHVEIEGVLGKNIKIENKDVVQMGESFVWSYKLGEKGKNTTRFLDFNAGDQKWKSRFDIHRGFPIEVSTRLTGIISSDKSILLLTDFLVNGWFDSLFGWENPYLSYQRWGVSVNYFKSIVDKNNLELQTTSVSLKYRLSQGVWNRSETVGVVTGIQNLTYRQAKANLFGLGIFWARSMPEFFDNIFNKVPFFRYPKFVDMELVFYPVGFGGDIESKLNTSLTFHGKMFVTSRFFIEAGFGFKKYSYSSFTANKRIDTTFIFGTGGLGYRF